MLIHRAAIAFAVSASFETWAQVFYPSSIVPYIFKIALLAFLYWNFAKGRNWARWIIASLILLAIVVLVAMNLQKPTSPVRLTIVCAILAVPLVLVLLPLPRKPTAADIDNAHEPTLN